MLPSYRMFNQNKLEEIHKTQSCFLGKNRTTLLHLYPLRLNFHPPPLRDKLHKTKKKFSQCDVEKDNQVVSQ